jgi:hypothetical protein
MDAAPEAMHRRGLGGRGYRVREAWEGQPHRRGFHVNEALPFKSGDSGLNGTGVATELRFELAEDRNHSALGVLEEHREDLDVVVHVGTLPLALNYGPVNDVDLSPSCLFRPRYW